MPALFARPLLFLDVDGPLIPFGAPEGYPEAQDRLRVRPQLTPKLVNPLLGRLNPEHGPRLLALPCDLIWATTWMAEANEVIAPLLGLPELPVVEGPDIDDDGPLHWKTRCLADWAAGRPFVWVDDEITPADCAWVAAHYSGAALLHRVDHRRGLTDADFAVIAKWLAHL
jgi:hypothetical protein